MEVGLKRVRLGCSECGHVEVAVLSGLPLGCEQCCAVSAVASWAVQCSVARPSVQWHCLCVSSATLPLTPLRGCPLWAELYASSLQPHPRAACPPKSFGYLCHCSVHLLSSFLAHCASASCSVDGLSISFASLGRPARQSPLFHCLATVVTYVDLPAGLPVCSALSVRATGSQQGAQPHCFTARL